jgi:hypothetical protein
MAGEADLQRLLAEMRPYLHDRPYVFCSVAPDVYRQLAVNPVGMFQEDEGVTLILDQPQAAALGLPYEEQWACITLRVYSALSAVGFLSTLATRLTAAGLSTNPVAGFYHDHLFVQWDRREEALVALRG